MQMSKEERLNATTFSNMDVEPRVDCTGHVVDPELVTKSKEEMKV
jgi:hypothetical protein